MFLRRLLPRLAVYYAICCIVLGIVLGEIAFHPERVAVQDRQQAQTTAARFKAPLRDIAITAQDGTQLSGWFMHPADADGDAVIILHGVGDNRQGMLGLAELFLSHGYTVLLPDSRAQGASGGGFVTYGIKEADDVRSWFDWLVNNDHPRCVFGMGESMGAAILLQALRIEPRFCAVVAESSFSSFRDIAYVRAGQIFHTGPWSGQTLFRPAVEVGLLYGRLRYGVNLALASPKHAVENVRTPALLIHGLADDNVPPQHSREIRTHNTGDIALWEVPRAGHCGAITVAPEEFDRRVLQWFANRKAGKAAYGSSGNFRSSS